MTDYSSAIRSRLMALDALLEDISLPTPDTYEDEQLAMDFSVLRRSLRTNMELMRCIIRRTETIAWFAARSGGRAATSASRETLHRATSPTRCTIPCLECGSLSLMQLDSLMEIDEVS